MKGNLYSLDLSAVSEEEFPAHLVEINDDWWIYYAEYPSAIIGSDSLTSAELPVPLRSKAKLLNRLACDPRWERWTSETYEKVINELCSLWVQVNPATRTFSCSHELLASPVEADTLEAGVCVLLHVLDQQESAMEALAIEVGSFDDEVIELSERDVALTEEIADALIEAEQTDLKQALVDLTTEVRKLRKQVALQNASYVLPVAEE
jgi:hypothetical protein